MTSYVGLDVSLKSTSICVVDADGKVIVEQSVDSDPDSIADFVQINAPGVQRVGLESRPTSVWLWRELGPELENTISANKPYNVLDRMSASRATSDMNVVFTCGSRRRAVRRNNV